MIDYIKGQIVELTPTYVVLEANGLGYFISIPLPA
ncbi:MAG: Holliday junction branch migration protein RuvA, partial [Paludibacteraceae bacterium]|nr:Holliday junction branch migration protein RuvA [Paludibacteraceae bacterium]